MKPRILVIDDEIKVLKILSTRLRMDGFDVFTASTDMAGMRLAYEMHPDVIVLDIIMPGVDGFEVCQRLRTLTDAIIILVSGRRYTEDIVHGLRVGADDYMVKPYNYKELVARMRAFLRRRANAPIPPFRLTHGEALLVADASRRLIFINDGRSVYLTPKEYDLLVYLVKNQGKVLSADALLANVWGPEYRGEHHLVKQFIYRLRNKIEQDPSNPEFIVTIRGSGYTFEEDTRPIPGKKKGSS
ncbi:MAG: response regulator [Anaerolineales bacterium]|nr:response regulator [Anaerolineales bacterium]